MADKFQSRATASDKNLDFGRDTEVQLSGLVARRESFVATK